MSIKSQTLEVSHTSEPVYLDCNATTPLEPEVLQALVEAFTENYGNAGSRTHSYGSAAKQAVQLARERLASLLNLQREEVIFTSGATEANNLAILGLESFGTNENKRHILSTQIEHKAVLEPLQELEQRGFEVELIAPTRQGWIDPKRIRASLRPDTLLVSVMHANNETGVVQPVDEIADELQNSAAFFHVDAAQTFGKLIDPLKNPRIDLVSVSAHKIYGPKGIGALFARRRGFEKIPLQPISYGGGQERGLRPGTLPVPLIVAFGVAGQIAAKNHDARRAKCLEIRQALVSAFEPFAPVINGDQTRTLPHVINLSFVGLDSEAVMLALKEVVAISNGSACTSSTYDPSHVLTAMGMNDKQTSEALRFSWCHLTPPIQWERVTSQIRNLLT